MVGAGVKGKTSMLARVSIINYHGETLIDKFVKPTEEVTDYRTQFSGITPHLLENGELSSNLRLIGYNFYEIRKEVKKLIRRKTVVGQSLHFDFRALKAWHPKHLIRDTQNYNMVFGTNQKTTTSLKKLAKEVLGLDIQKGEHDSVEDAKVCMLLYRLRQNEWEKYLINADEDALKKLSTGIVCYSCGSVDHINKTCSNKTKCFECGSLNHLKKDCNLARRRLEVKRF
ncbi:4860_t:CDS:2 [Acaulospora morrowiae]|uniref:RNA exonuclease 4 n=1 Tax=Acaulospora morrowiae TaxID=94023 RepID=A0A9N9GR13_9GLOM|nr:4860_t:CDS:2 [Acaulospora morrowiae]